MSNCENRSRHFGRGRWTSYPVGSGKRYSAPGRPAAAGAFGDPAALLEYEDVLKRPEHQLAHGLPPEAVDEFLAELAALIEPVEVHFQWRPQARDPNDEMVLEAAINGRADALVTYNIADFARAAERFRVPVLHPAELLKKVKL